MAAEYQGPIPDSYWVSPGRLLAGEYPGAKDDGQARRKLRRIVEAGVTFFLDLTEAGEYGLKPYSAFVEEQMVAGGRAITHQRMPIPDGGTPTAADMGRILETIDEAIAAGQTVYVHCWGGIGRTGTVVGCWLVRHGMSGPQALEEIERRRRGTPDGERRSPENEEQERMVVEWCSSGQADAPTRVGATGLATYHLECGHCHPLPRLGQPGQHHFQVLVCTSSAFAPPAGRFAV